MAPNARSSILDSKMYRHALKSVATLLIALLFASTANAVVWIDAYFADTNQPLQWKDPRVPYVYQDIMAGTSLRLVVSGNTTGSRNGEQLIQPIASFTTGQLFARGFNEEKRHWEGSVTPEAGDRSRVWKRVDLIDGEFYQGYGFLAGITTVPGPWFVFDYNACKVGELDIRWTRGPLEKGFLEFNHVYSRDYSGDTRVSFEDFAHLAAKWQELVVEDVNAIARLDLDENATIEPNDMKLFTQFWLARTHGAQCPEFDPGF